MRNNFATFILLLFIYLLSFIFFYYRKITKVLNGVLILESRIKILARVLARVLALMLVYLVLEPNQITVCTPCRCGLFDS